MSKQTWKVTKIDQRLEDQLAAAKEQLAATEDELEKLKKLLEYKEVAINEINRMLFDERQQLAEMTDLAKRLREMLVEYSGGFKPQPTSSKNCCKCEMCIRLKQLLDETKKLEET
jgi:septal ring factor EnvC (AmiA/AmiB activator)